MGLYASSQKVLVSSNHPHHAAAWHTDRTYPGICGCTVYLHCFLRRTAKYILGILTAQLLDFFIWNE